MSLDLQSPALFVRWLGIFLAKDLALFLEIKVKIKGIVGLES
jgi:hypothetical protein